ncbi:hypothetical protein [Streptacidiphilus melanogenes]|uniref:hypothetical protein n=1 Tax=Streptacidiphilus melanogenes TaxID=411235 RepID=UPI0005AABF65|nr:hypothetical protein [Streptacidiphilus melanogenes]
MDGGFGVASKTLAARLGRLRRYRWWLARLLAALPAVALLAYGLSAPHTADGASTPASIFWQDAAPPLLLLAATLAQGASGRPRPLLHLAAGARSPKPATAPSRARQRHRKPSLHWDESRAEQTGLLFPWRPGLVRAPGRRLARR